MSDYIKLFDSKTQQDNFAESEDYIQPHISCTKGGGNLKYNNGSGGITADSITPELLEDEEILRRIRNWGLSDEEVASLDLKFEFNNNLESETYEEMGFYFEGKNWSILGSNGMEFGGFGNSYSYLREYLLNNNVQYIKTITNNHVTVLKVTDFLENEIVLQDSGTTKVEILEDSTACVCLGLAIYTYTS